MSDAPVRKVSGHILEAQVRRQPRAETKIRSNVEGLVVSYVSDGGGFGSIGLSMLMADEVLTVSLRPDLLVQLVEVLAHAQQTVVAAPAPAVTIQ